MLNTGKLAGKTLYITGASRGIGKAIALKAARDGANVVVAAKTADPHPKLPGTIFTAAKEIEDAGGKALPSVVDVRDEAQIQESVEAAVKKFGGIDIVVNNASAISLTGTEFTSMKKYDLMHSINTRGTYLVSKLALPYLKTSTKNPQILNISPPLNMSPRWFKDHCAYTMAKYGMSMCVLGMAEEFKKDRIGVNALWPRTAIITAAMEMLGGKDVAKQCRTVDIMADAAYVILTRDGKNFTGNFVVDEEILKEEGCIDFDQYAVVPGSDLMPDFFLDDFDTSNIPKDQMRFVDGKDTAAAGGGGAGSGGVAAVFERIKGHINEELVKKTNAVFAFKVEGTDAGNWYLDLKNGSGACGMGEPPVPPADTTFTIKDADFHDLFQGKLKPASAFMSGKLKLSGDMGKAMALDKVMSKMHSRGFHTHAALHAEAPVYKDVDQVFDRIKEVASPEVVSKVGASYLFDVEGSGKYFVDLKNGDGSVTKGEPADKPDVTIAINQANIIKMFNRELKPATAFMTGQIKLSGDLAKAMALESVMVAARKSYHTWAGGNYSYQQRRWYSGTPPPATYENVPQVFDRIKSVCSKDIVDQVQAVYLFDVEQEGKYFVDFKNGEGEVGSGEPPQGKPDVTIKMNETNFLKIFNRQVSPASAFMTGQIKVSGDLAKALTLEKVMKAAREAAEKGA